METSGHKNNHAPWIHAIQQEKQKQRKFDWGRDTSLSGSQSWSLCQFLCSHGFMPSVCEPVAVSVSVSLCVKSLCQSQPQSQSQSWLSSQFQRDTNRNSSAGFPLQLLHALWNAGVVFPAIAGKKKLSRAFLRASFFLVCVCVFCVVCVVFAKKNGVGWVPALCDPMECDYDWGLGKCLCPKSSQPQLNKRKASWRWEHFSPCKPDCVDRRDVSYEEVSAINRSSVGLETSGRRDIDTLQLLFERSKISLGSPAYSYCLKGVKYHLRALHTVIVRKE